jgi:hypothetical protein
MGTFAADKFRIEKPKLCPKHAPSEHAKAAVKCVAATTADAGDPRISLYGNVHMVLYEKRKAKKK